MDTPFLPFARYMPTMAAALCAFEHATQHFFQVKQPCAVLGLVLLHYNIVYASFLLVPDVSVDVREMAPISRDP